MTFRITRTGQGREVIVEKYAAPWGKWTWIRVRMSDMNPCCGDTYEDTADALNHIYQNITNQPEFVMTTI